MGSRVEIAQAEIQFDHEHPSCSQSTSERARVAGKPVRRFPRQKARENIFSRLQPVYIVRRVNTRLSIVGIVNDIITVK